MTPFFKVVAYAFLLPGCRAATSMSVGEYMAGTRRLCCSNRRSIAKRFPTFAYVILNLQYKVTSRVMLPFVFESELRRSDVHFPWIIRYWRMSLTADFCFAVGCSWQVHSTCAKHASDMDADLPCAI